jgi:uncharacterized membrane protein
MLLCLVLSALGWSIVAHAQDSGSVLALESGALFIVHPIVVHFAIALVLFGFLTDWFGSLRAHEPMQQTGRLCFFVGVGALGLAVLSGWVEQELPRPPSVFDTQMQDVLFRHEYLGYGLFALFLVLAIIRVRIQGRLPLLFVLLAVLGSIGMIIQGYFGGELVYRYGAGVRAVQVLSTQLSESGQKKAPE